jgi:toxin ParE1/3/4
MFDRSAAGFGISARRRYEALVEAALADLQTEPIRLGSLDRAELGVGVRTYHLRNSRARAKTKDGVVRNPRHLIAYEFDQTRVLILRVLHDAMDLARHVQPPDPDDVSM